MSTYILRLAAVACAVHAVPLLALAAPPSAADFLPIAAEGSSTVTNPAAVEIDAAKGHVTAASGQDAANVAVKQTVDKLSSSSEPSSACFMMFPSGCGVLATGKADYKIVPNAQLSRIAQRRAYVQAFMWAKKEMARFLAGLDNQAREQVAQVVAELSDANAGNAGNLSVTDVGEIQQSVSKLLRGFVVFEVSDKQEDGIGTVYVSIATSPATCLKTGRKAAGFVSEATLAEGIDRMILEIRQGVVAPVGGRIIEVPGTGETAFVGFGAAVVGDNADPQMRKALLEKAKRTAKMYADDALCGMIRGDLSGWTGSVVDKYRNSHEEFVNTQQGDPLNADEAGSMQRLGQAVKTMVNTSVETNVLTSARSGRTLEGIPIQVWLDDEKHWAYAVAIYAPSLSKKARELGKMMDDAELVPSDKKPQPLSPRDGDSSVPGAAPDGSQPLPTIKPLPSGKVGGQKL